MKKKLKLNVKVTCGIISQQHSIDRNSPPQFSRLNRLLKLWLTNGEIFFRSWVRTLVARSDWWASLKVVSISNSPWWARTALANPSGPSRSSTSRKPTGGSPDSDGGAKKNRERKVTGENDKGKMTRKSTCVYMWWSSLWEIHIRCQRKL